MADGLRWESPDRWHLTLQFLGPLPRLAPVVDGVAAAVGERDAFLFRLGGAGAFPNRAGRGWCGSGGAGATL